MTTERLEFMLRAKLLRTTAMTTQITSQTARPSRLNIVRVTGAGAVTMFILFVSCWLGTAFTSLRLSHMFIELFTAAPVTSVNALAEGMCWSLVFGALTGFLLAWSYNQLAFLSRE
jgi:hypothetical protein